MCIKKQCFTENFYIFLLCIFFYHTFSLFHYFSFIEFLPSPDLSYSKLLLKPYFSPDTDFLPGSPTPLQCHFKVNFKVNFKVTSIKFHFTLKYSSILPIPGKVDSVFRYSVIKNLTIYAPSQYWLYYPTATSTLFPQNATPYL